MQSKGKKAFEKQKYAKAISFFTQAIEANPDDVTLYGNSSLHAKRIGSAAYMEIKNFSKALKDAEKAIEKNNKYDTGYFRKANALRSLHKISEARQVLEKSPIEVFKNKKIRTLFEELKQESGTDFALPKG